jgi:hypothetical protein
MVIDDDEWVGWRVSLVTRDTANGKDKSATNPQCSPGLSQVREGVDSSERSLCSLHR